MPGGPDLFTVVISGGFSLVVAAATSRFMISRDQKLFNMQIKNARYEELKLIYSAYIGAMDRLIQTVVNEGDELSLVDEIYQLNSKLSLICPSEISRLSDNYWNSVRDWANAYRAGKPKGLVINQSQTQKENVKNLFIKVNDVSLNLTQKMREHLHEFRL